MEVGFCLWGRLIDLWCVLKLIFDSDERVLLWVVRVGCLLMRKGISNSISKIVLLVFIEVQVEKNILLVDLRESKRC